MLKHGRSGDVLDVLLMEKELFSSRKAALSAIMNGFVLVDGTKITKAGKNISVLSKIELIPSYKPSRYVRPWRYQARKGFERVRY